MRRFLEQVDVTDEEHGAAWLCTDGGHTLEWSDAVLVFSGPGFDPPSRHIRKVTRERALDLWGALRGAPAASFCATRWPRACGATTEQGQRVRCR